jgi:hypothetical protein
VLTVLRVLKVLVLRVLVLKVLVLKVLTVLSVRCAGIATFTVHLGQSKSFCPVNCLEAIGMASAFSAGHGEVSY